MANDQVYSVFRFRYALLHFITGQAAQMLAVTLHLLIVVRILSITDYGIYMLVIGIPETVLFLASFGILNLGQRYLPQLAGTVKNTVVLGIVTKMLQSQAGILIALALISIVTWPTVVSYFHLTESQSQIIYYIIPLTIFIPLFRMICEFLDALLEQKTSQLMRAIMPVGRVLIITILIIGGLRIDLQDIFLIEIIVAFACLIFAYILLVNKVKALPESDGSPPDAREMMRFAWHMAPVNMLSAASTPGAVRLVASSALSLVDIGLFGFLQSIRRLALKLLPGMLFRGLVRPILITRTLSYGNLDLLKYGTNLLWKMNNLLIGAVCTVVIMVGDYLVFAASGGKYESAGITLLLILVVLSISSQRLILNMMIQIIGYTQILRSTAIISPIALLVIWLVAGWGLNIIVTVLGVSIALSNGIVLLMLKKKHYAIMLDWRGNLKIITSVATASIIGLSASYTGSNDFVSMLASLLVYVVVLYWLKPFRIEELDLLKKGVGERLYKYLQFVDYFSVKPK